MLTALGYTKNIISTGSVMPRNQRAFTLVEVIIVVAVIGILATLTTLGIGQYQAMSRDAQRSSSIATIAEALEKYYDENGEYPSCAAITADGSTVSSNTLKGIDKSVLVVPGTGSSTTNSVRCGAVLTVNGVDFFEYVGDGTATCTTGESCSSWQLRYKNEQTNNIATIDSRRKAKEETQAPVLTLAASGYFQINASWTGIADATSYELQRSGTAGFSSVATTKHTSTTANIDGLTSGTTYYFRVRAIVQDTNYTAWSAVKSAQTGTVTAPTGTIGITATISGSNARGTSTGGTCASGSTVERQIRFNTNDGSWSSWTTGSPRDVAATEGDKYTFQAQARCTAFGINSAWVQSSTASVNRPVSVPTDLTITATMSGTNARGTADGTCAPGTTIEYQIRYQSTNTSTAGSWSSWTDGDTRDVAASQGYRYTFQQQARCIGTNSNSAWAASGSADVTRPISTPAAPSVSVSTNGDITTFTRSDVSCPAGTTTRYQVKFAADWGYDSAWAGPTTGQKDTTWNTASQGYNYQVQLQAHCYTPHATSGWSGSGVGNFTRGVDNPTNIGWSFTRNGNTIIYITPNGNCGPGVSFYGSMSEYSGSSPHTWAGGPNSGKLGWYQDSGYRVNNVFFPSGGIQSRNGTTYGSGNQFAGRGEFRCKNQTTGRESGLVGNTSGIWTW